MEDETPRQSSDTDAPAIPESGVSPCHTEHEEIPPLPTLFTFSSAEPNFIDRIDELMKGFGEDGLPDRGKS